MKEDKEHSSILIDIDSLFDLRLSRINKVDSDSIERILKGGYHTRLRDDFDIDMKKYGELDNDNNKDILTEAIVTPMLILLEEFAIETISNSINTPHKKVPEIILNVYPFKLTDKESSNLINPLIKITNELASISIVSMTIEEITPTYLKKNISIFITYNYYQWLEQHSVNSNIKKVTCPSVTMLGPSIFFREKNKEFEKVDIGKVFKTMMEMTKPVINLVLLPIENFSSIIGKELNKK